MQDIKPRKYLRYLVPLSLFGTQRTKEILSVNPTVVPKEKRRQRYLQNRISCINIDGLRKAESDLLDDRTTKYFKDVYLSSGHHIREIKTFRKILDPINDSFCRSVLCCRALRT